MDKTRITYLHERYLQNRLTQPELVEWKLILDEESTQPLIRQLVDETWEQLAVKDLAPLPEGRSQVILENVLVVPKAKSAKRLWPKVAIAAAVATIVFGAGLFYFNRNKPVVNQDIAYQNDVDPGTVGATLTLSNGKKIRLSAVSKGELAQEAGVTISKTKDGQLVYQMNADPQDQGKTNTLSTSNGETYIVSLPDGSKVWLNAASSLTYNASLLEQGKRIVSLTGEGYFEIAKDKSHPFVVETSGQQIEVLGTHFNVNSYSDESAIATTLVEGSVKVSSGNTQKIIKPGEQAKGTGGNLKINKIDLDNVIDWKDGEFNLDGLEFKTAMRKIARWYNVEVIYDNTVPDNVQFGGLISRDAKLSTILEGIERFGFVHFKVKGKEVYVSR